MKWEYGTMHYWRERSEMVSADGAWIYGSMPYEWPWRARWTHKGTIIDYNDPVGDDKHLLNDLGAEGWEVIDRQVERISFPASFARNSATHTGVGLPLHQTVDVSISYLMKRSVGDVA
jgi:hypothetical protein